MYRDMQRDEAPWSGDSLDRPSGEDYGVRRGRQPGHVMNSSAYTRAALSDVGRALPLSPSARSLPRASPRERERRETEVTGLDGGTEQRS